VREAFGSNASSTGRADTADLIQTVIARGYTEDEIERTIDTLLRTGEASEPEMGFITLR
jgi:voltage-gated potassium channel Kch